jgi:hypothetical protein
VNAELQTRNRNSPTEAQQLQISDCELPIEFEEEARFETANQEQIRNPQFPGPPFSPSFILAQSGVNSVSL